MTTDDSTRESGQEPDGKEEIDSSEETPTVAEALDTVDTGDPYPRSPDKLHVYEPGEESSLCGHATLAVDGDRNRAADAAHDHSLLNSHRICGNCSRSVRARVRGRDLTTGDATLDNAIRATEGDEILVETPEATHRVVVETTEWSAGRQRVRGEATDYDGGEVSFPSASTKVSVRPDGSVSITAPGSLFVSDDRKYDTGDLRPTGDTGAAEGGQSA